jgi:hypothetical protein
MVLLSFYADTNKVKNGKFKFKINKKSDWEKSVARFRKLGFVIRSAWVTEFNNGVRGVNNRVL